MSGPDKRVLLAKPRGYCAGVDRAVEAVERALEQHGPPVYVRKQIVHNVHVVRDPHRSAARSSWTRPTRCRRVRWSCSPRTGCRRRCATRPSERQLRTIDATCPLVTKVHQEAKRFAREDYDILLVGHHGHEEVEGTAGEAPANIQLVRDRVRRGRGDRARPGEGGVAVADHAVGGRDHGHGAGAARAVPDAAEPAERRHLLRHPEPAGRGEGDGRRGATWCWWSGRRNSSNSVRLVEVALSAGAGRRASDRLRPRRSTTRGWTG